MKQNIKPLIEIQNLDVEYWQQNLWVTVVEGLNLKVIQGETFGLVGESGCGKSTTANAMMGYQPAGCSYRHGQVLFNEKNLLKLEKKQISKLVGAEISLVPQNPTTALSPGMRIGRQITETLLVHSYCKNQKDARQRALDLISMVSLPSAGTIFQKYPHQLSGGQQQRVLIAMALSCDPKLVILDEPTTGLDVTTQAQILDLLSGLRDQYGLSMFYITHNLGVVAQICDRIGVMYAGRLVEVAPRHTLFVNPKHPYTQGLIASVPRISAPSRTQTLLLQGLLNRNELPPGCPFAPRCEFALEQCFLEKQSLQSTDEFQQVSCWRVNDIPSFDERSTSRANPVYKNESIRKPEGMPFLTVKDLSGGYFVHKSLMDPRRSYLPIVESINFDVRSGETFALVGESGSGKTTIARALSGLLPKVTGDIKFDAKFDLTIPMNRRDRECLRLIQFVFQNPDASMNPRQPISQIISRPLEMFFKLSASERRSRVEALLESVRLEKSYYRRYPDELSGGERQRIAIARALAAEPKLILCDEILSALDVSVQANVIELLLALQDERKLAFIFISHDLAVVRSLAHSVGVLYWGSLCETGEVEEVFSPPYHPYTYLLISAVPEADPNQARPSMRLDQGLLRDQTKHACPYATRCPWKAGPVCESTIPPWRKVSATHQIHCHLSLEELEDREQELWQIQQ